MRLLGGFTRRSTQRGNFVADSLANSSDISTRLLESSKRDDRARLFPLRFSSEWNHPDCPVVAWYKQQQRSSTRFRSIEHRKNKAPPFYHEFLLLKLTDGAVCRLERFGEGSRADALSHVGCMSHDVIQWYDESSALNALGIIPTGISSRPSLESELVAEIDFGREFDILDVLAVCYSIQRVKRCSVYTLQRYNCYFLCLTVLAVLARRVASWETILTNAVWSTVVASAVRPFSRQPIKDMDQLLLVRMCTALEPDNPQATQAIISLIPKYLAPESCIPTNCTNAIAAVLWESVFEVALDEALNATLAPQVGMLLSEAHGYSATRLLQFITSDRSDIQREIMANQHLAHYTCKMLVRSASKAGFAGLPGPIISARSRQVEQYPSLEDQMFRELTLLTDLPFLLWRFPQALEDNPVLKMIFSTRGRRMRLLLACFRTKILDGPRRLDLENTWLHRLHAISQLPDYTRCGPAFETLVLTLYHLHIFPLWTAQSLCRQDSILMTKAAFELMIQNHVTRFPPDLSNELLGEKPWHTQIFAYCESILSTHTASVFTPLQLGLLFSLMLSSSSFAALLVQCISLNLVQLMNEAFESEHAYLSVAKPSQTRMPVLVERMTCAQFQNAYILPRIGEHAKRVYMAGLAEYETVCEDITITMAHVWRAMPSGFGSGIYQD